MSTEPQTKADTAIVARMKEIHNLVSEFGLTLLGYDPGVSAFIKDDPKAPALSFDSMEWAWLEPLLKELRELRN